MLYAILMVLFAAVFGFITWRIFSGQKPKPVSPPSAVYECPICNEAECDCHKKEDISDRG
jgi:hypothetical protein